MFSRSKTIPLDPVMGERAANIFRALARQQLIGELTGEWRPTPMLTSYGRTELRFAKSTWGMSTTVSIGGKKDFQLTENGRVKLFSEHAKRHANDRVRWVLDEIESAMEQSLNTSGPSIRRGNT